MCGHIVYFPVEGIYEIWNWHKFIAGPFQSRKEAEKYKMQSKRVLTIYRRIPGTHEIREMAKHPNIPADWTAKDILERFGLREHLKVVLSQPGQPDWVVQDFEPHS